MRRKNDTLYKDPRSSEIVETDAKLTPQEKHDISLSSITTIYC